MADELAPIIIKKVVKGGDAAHHGGAWKVAYADFVTAMMAFFLLLWLLNATTEEQKRGISDYFAPANTAKTTSGAGSVLGGLHISREGAMQTMSSPPAVSVPLPSFSGDQASDETGNQQQANREPREEQETQEAPEEPTSVPEDPDPVRLDELLAKREQEEFAKAEERLRQAIQKIPDLRQLADNLIVDMTPEGMRIQIVDQDRLAMFPLGSTQMYDHTRHLMAQVAKVIKILPNNVSVSGHTDGTPFASTNGYSNWELSSDRANASRRMLIEAGLDPARIATVIGKADKEHLFPDEPTSPRNRRISIVLLRSAWAAAAARRAAASRSGRDALPEQVLRPRS
jgi:chemotaxis protein MotB